MAGTSKKFGKRRMRVRKAIRTASHGRLRLSVFRSSKHIYAQVIDDAKAVTVAAASTLEKDLRGSVTKTTDAQAAEAVGKLIAERAKRAGIEEVIFDRGGYLFHGRVKALADGAREGGLRF